MREYIALLRANPDYRNLWLARVVSNLGDWFNLLASAALITSLTGAGTAISYLFLARLLPVFVMSPFAGVFADRYERRTIMILTDVLRAVTVLCFLFVRSADQIWLLYALTVIQFVLSSLYTPAHSALLSNIVQAKDLVTANALDGFTWSAMLAIGALLGGIAAALFGTTTAFVLDALTFLVSAYFVLQIKGATAVRGRTAASAAGGRSGGMFDFLAGMGYLRARPFILGLALVKAGGAFIWGVINVMEIPLAQQIFPINGNGTLTMGLVYASVGLGTGFGPLLVRRWVGDAPRSQLGAITLGFVTLCIGAFGVGLAPSLPWVLVGSVLRSLGTGTLWVFSAAMLQHLVADEYRGRVFAFEFAVMTLTQSVATVLAGIALDTLHQGPQDVVVGAALLCVGVTAGWWWFLGRVQPQPAPTPLA
jgi:MFS family permease